MKKVRGYKDYRDFHKSELYPQVLELASKQEKILPNCEYSEIDTRRGFIVVIFTIKRDIPGAEYVTYKRKTANLVVDKQGNYSLAF